MALILSEIDVSLGRRPVLHGVSATFERGRVTAILGPNGAGKSTLLKTAAGLIGPSAGLVELEGATVSAMPPRERARRIGYLAQGGELAWSIPARELVALGRSPWRSPFAALSDSDRAAIEAAMAAADVTAFADRLTGELSGGERARAMLARVLASEPEWLLADEPLASLDPAHQVDILARFRAAADAGAGVVIVLHDLSHAARVADEVLLLKDGRVVGSGPTGAVLRADLLRDTYEVEFDVVETAHGLAILAGRS